MENENKRTFDSFKWITIPRFDLMVGFGVSRDWKSRHPWSRDGENRPYVAWILEEEKVNEASTTRVYALYLGPFIMHWGKMSDH